jgi:TRAP-type uncharacterized transport system fused permease subunit
MRLGMAAYLVPFVFVYWPALVLWHEAEALQLIAALGGGILAVIGMAGLGERYLFRPLSWLKLAMLAGCIPLIMHPALWANALAAAIAFGVIWTEYRATRLKTASLPL